MAVLTNRRNSGRMKAYSWLCYNNLLVSRAICSFVKIILGLLLRYSFLWISVEKTVFFFPLKNSFQICLVLNYKPWFLLLCSIGFGMDILKPFFFPACLFSPLVLLVFITFLFFLFCFFVLFVFCLFFLVCFDLFFCFVLVFCSFLNCFRYFFPPLDSPRAGSRWSSHAQLLPPPPLIEHSCDADTANLQYPHPRRRCVSRPLNLLPENEGV